MSALYDTIGTTYAQYRVPDERIARQVASALRDSASVVNVGSGTGAYEPRATGVLGVEPSRVMLSQRESGTAPVLQGVAERLPLADSSFDASLALLTVHHWPDAEMGLAEMVRVSRRQIVLTWDPAVFRRFWLIEEYLPEIAEREAQLATLGAVCRALNVVDVQTVPVPWDCTDGFCGAYWQRPERYLDPGARGAISAISLLDPADVERAMHRLKRDLDDGSWTARHPGLGELSELDLGYRLVVAERA